MDRERRTAGSSAFTLVEMLVALGIITVLAAILLPTVTAARRAAANTKCLSNLRQIGMAVAQYMSDNDQTIPPGVSSNTWDDPASVRGAFLRPPPYQFSDTFWWPASSMPVASFLDAYMKYDLNVWRCPGAKLVRGEPTRMLRAGEMVQSDPDHGRLWGSQGQWRPGYMYVSTGAWGWFYTYWHPMWVKYDMEDWVVRSVGGLKVSEAKTVTLQPPSEIVLFLDYSSLFHSKAPDEVYALNQPAASHASPNAHIVREKFQSNFLYLDGHAETRGYAWQGGLLNVLHRPIAPGSYAGRMSGPYAREFPD